MPGHGFSVTLVLLLASTSLAQQAPDTSLHKALSVQVQNNVHLEVLDWGGSGTPLVFLAGLGDTAHRFDNFAPKFTGRHHVYSITRRGFGNSSRPERTVANFSAARLGEDVFQVIEQLHIARPVLIGHSLAGEELSWVATNHPEAVRGLVYIDAALPFALYTKENPDWILDMLAVQHEIDALERGGPADHAAMRSMLQDVTQLQADLQQEVKSGEGKPDAHFGLAPPEGLPLIFGEQRFTRITVPALVLSACPPSFDFIRNNPELKAALIADVTRRCSAQAQGVKESMPNAKVILIPHSDHDLIASNEADVVRDINQFLDSLR